MNKYLITLTPISKFYFGGETTFKRVSREEDEKKKQNKSIPFYDELKKFDNQFGSYVVKSNLFPQQTSLLGMLRFLILSNNKTIFQNNKIIKGNDKTVEKEIGKESFRFSPTDTKKQEFGRINSIFPCFIQRKTANSEDWEDIYPTPMDHQLDVSFSEKKILTIHNKAKYNTSKNKDVDYNPKDGLNLCYLGNKTMLMEEDLFQEDIRIGIDRDFKGKVKDAAYYKQISYKFKERYKSNNNKEVDQSLRFAFYAELDLNNTHNIKEKKHVISLGGDNSRFILEIKDINNTEPELPILYNSGLFNNCFGKIILLSETYLEKQDLQFSFFHISDIVPFRFLTSNINVTNYYRFTGENKLNRSDKYNLYKRGSVFFFETKEKLQAFETALKKHLGLTQIGYNQFKTIIK